VGLLSDILAAYDDEAGVSLICGKHVEKSVVGLASNCRTTDGV